MLRNALIIDHRHTDLNRIPDVWITQAKNTLHIAYQHTSHGSQIVTGMGSLRDYPSFGTKYDFDDAGVRAGALDLDDYGIPGGSADLSTGDYIDANGVTPWVTATRNLLDNPDNNHVNVIVWSWCSINGHDIPRYLTNMEILIAEYGPGGTKPRAAAHPVTFVFMTGHAEGQGEDGFIHAANQQIRQHCLTNGRVLYDFADIESYNPDGAYFYDRYMYDNLDYTTAANTTGNWGAEWIAAHIGSELEMLTTGNGVGDGYTGCTGCAHSDSPAAANINCVLKGRAFWWMLASISGWSGDSNACTATIDESLLLQVPYLSYIDPMSEALSFRAVFVYEFNPAYPTFILFKLTNAAIIDNPIFLCAASTLSSDFRIHIPDVLFPDGITRLWVNLAYEPAFSTDGNAYFMVTDYGDI